MSGILITDGNIVDQTPIKTERTRAMEVGRIPFGQTVPAVHLCGSCRSVEVTKEDPICQPCDKKLTNREFVPTPIPFVVRLVAIVGGFAILTLAYWALAK